MFTWFLLIRSICWKQVRILQLNDMQYTQSIRFNQFTQDCDLGCPHYQLRILQDSWMIGPGKKDCRFWPANTIHMLKLQLQLSFFKLCLPASCRECVGRLPGMCVLGEQNETRESYLGSSFTSEGYMAVIIRVITWLYIYIIIYIPTYGGYVRSVVISIYCPNRTPRYCLRLKYSPTCFHVGKHAFEEFDPDGRGTWRKEALSATNSITAVWSIAVDLDIIYSFHLLTLSKWTEGVFLLHKILQRTKPSNRN